MREKREKERESECERYEERGRDDPILCLPVKYPLKELKLANLNLHLHTENVEPLQKQLIKVINGYNPGD